MRNHRIDRDHQVEVGDIGGRPGDGSRLRGGRSQGRRLALRFRSVLQAVKIVAGQIEYRGELAHGNRAGGIPGARCPQQANLRPRGMAQRAAIRIDRDVGNLRRDIIDGRAERARQLHDLDLLVPLGSRFEPTDHLVDAGDALEQLHHLGMRFDDEVRRLLAQNRREADELDRVAEAVQTSQDDALAGQGLTVPEAIRVGSAAARDRFALLPGAVETAEQHPAHPSAAGALVGVVAGLFGPVVGGERVVDAALGEMIGGERKQTLAGRVTHVFMMPWKYTPFMRSYIFLLLCAPLIAQINPQKLVDLTYDLDEKTVNWPTAKPFEYQRETWGVSPGAPINSSSRFSKSVNFCVLWR